MSATGQMYDELENKLIRLQKQFDVYQKAVNKIDDYFEYRNESVDDGDFVRTTLNELTNSLTQI